MPENTLSFLPLLQTLVGGAIAIAGVAANQLWTTKREVGKRKVELAEEVLSLFYEAADAIGSIRSPMGLSNEGRSRQRAENETEQESQRLDNAYVAIERYQRYETLFSTLRSKKFRFKAVFRESSHESFQEIDRVLLKIHSAARMLGTFYWKDRSHRRESDAEIERHRLKTEEQEAIFWAQSENDPLNPLIESAIRKIEAYADMAAKEYAGPPGWWMQWNGFPGWWMRWKAFVEAKDQ